MRSGHRPGALCPRRPLWLHLDLGIATWACAAASDDANVSLCRTTRASPGDTLALPRHVRVSGSLWARESCRHGRLRFWRTRSNSRCTAGAIPICGGCTRRRGVPRQSRRLGPRKCEFLAGVLRLLRRFNRFRLIASWVRLGPQPEPPRAWGRSIGRAEALSTLRNRGEANRCEAAAATSRGRA